MSTRPWFPFYPGDFYQDSALLTLEQQGAYIRLLAYAWTHEGVIPGDSRSLGRILGVHSNKAAVLWEHLRPFWYPETEKPGGGFGGGLRSQPQGGFRQKRLDEELRKYLEISGKRRKAANKRHHAKAPAIAPASAYTTTIKKEKINKKERKPTPPPDDLPVSDNLRSWAEKQGLPNGGWLEEQVQTCLDWHRSKGNLYADWEAVCRTWLRRAKEYGRVEVKEKSWI